MAESVFSHVGMCCADPLKVERFYSRYFGFRRGRVIQAGDEQIVMTRSGNVWLEIFKAKEPAHAPATGGAGPEYPGWRHLAFTVSDVDAKIAEMGEDARVTLGPLSFDAFIPGWRTAWVADPEGNIVEITQGYVDERNPPPLPPES